MKDTVDKFPEWRKRMKELQAAASSKNNDEVIKLAPEVIAMYPDFVERDSAYELLADAYWLKAIRPRR